ncbi:MAG: hypothetical protein JWN95_2035 [Frankiales bacterium]|nr:hypothetical protein [Frankiales bacterium]
MANLIEPSSSVRLSFLSAMDDFVNEGRGSAEDDSALGRQLRTFGRTWDDEIGFASFVAATRADGSPASARADGWTWTSTYWYVEGTDYLGSLRIRHESIPPVLHTAGHIGYDIAPAARRRGHGTRMLAEALPLAAALGLPEVLITCAVDNVGSRKIIEHNGGRYVDERAGILRFWVKTGRTD